MTAATTPPTGMPRADARRSTFEQYLALDHERGLAEWVDGEVVLCTAATEPHQRAAEFLLTLLRLFVRLRGLGCVIGAPYPMRALPGGNAREPDVMFVARDHLDRLTRTHLEGPADLVVIGIFLEGGRYAVRRPSINGAGGCPACRCGAHARRVSPCDPPASPSLCNAERCESKMAEATTIVAIVALE